MTVADFLFLDGEGRVTTDLRAGPGDNLVTLPFPLLRFRDGPGVILRAVRVVPEPATAPDAVHRAETLARRWAPRVPAAGLRLPDGLWWRPAAAVRVKAADLPPGRTRFAWTVSYHPDDGSTLLREATATVTVEADDGSMPMREATPTARVEAEGEPGRLDVNDGWIALDYGTTRTSITMFDQKYQTILLGLPRTQAAIIRQRLAGFLDGDQPEETVLGLPATEWRRTLENAGYMLTPPSAPQSEPLAVARTVLNGDLPRLLVALERQAAETRRPELALALHRLYAEAFEVPPIREQRMVPIPLHAERETIGSEVEVLSLAPLKVRMAADGIVLDPTGATQRLPAEVRYQPALKQYLGTGRPLPGLPPDHPDPVSTDDVLAAAWQCLMRDKVAKFCQEHPDEYSTKPITRAVITYPTVAPPQTRLDVERLARRIGLDHVVTDYDEATAAAMFYLMRDFAGDPAVGIEAYRAHSRPDPSGRSWRRNILVVDIGGGTTDIALIGITLHDETEFEQGRPPETQGRYYVLRPTVRAKAGRAQLGGDRITLGIFNHLKAVLADRLLTLDPRIVQGEYPPFLQEGVYQAGSLLSPIEDGRAAAIREDLIDEVIPTRWAHGTGDTQKARQRFRLLWEEAELAKTRQSEKEGDYVVRHVGERLGLTGKAGDAVQKIPEVTIGHAEIAAIIEDVVRRAFHIALNVVKNSLQPDGDGIPEPLDTVMVSGGSSALPQVQRILREVFVGAGDAIRWNPMNVVYEPAFAKTGTSIGACWAEHVRQKGFSSAQNAIRRVGRGLTELHIDVDNLFHALPNTFILDAQGGQNVPVFHLGDEFDRILTANGVEGRRRSAWENATEGLVIYRQPFSLEEKHDAWGSLNVATMRDALGEHDLDLAAWLDQVIVQFEIDERNLLTAYFCHRSGPAHLVSFARAHPVPDLVRLGPDGVPVVQEDVILNPHSAGGMASAGQVIFPRGTRLVERLALADEHGAPVRGVISGTLSKDVPADGKWTFHRRHPGDPEGLVTIDAFPAPSAGRLGHDMVAILDEKGRLTVIPAYPPHVEATGMADVLERPGAVLRQAMTPGVPDVDDRFDPFNGMH